MNPSPEPVDLDRYPPRITVALGRRIFSSFDLKLYGLHLEGNGIEDADVRDAEATLAPRLAAVAADPHERLPGFVILHKGTEGVTLSAYWWIEGCILCHDHMRRPYNGVDPLAAVRGHVVGCVWELAIIDHERRAWQETMMGETPDPAAYLESLPAVGT